MEVLTLQLPLGCYPQKETRTMPLSEAYGLLTTKKQRDYTSAYLQNGQATLIRHFIQCPHCGRRVRLYAREFNEAFGTRRREGKAVPRDTLTEWAAQQLSFFRPEPEKLRLNRPVLPQGTLVCPECKNSFSCNSKRRQVTFERHRHKVVIRAQMMDIAEFLTLPCVYRRNIQPTLPVYETVCFNFRNGHTSLGVETVHGQRLGTWDVTGCRDDWKQGVVHDCIAKNKRLRRTLHRLFTKEWGAPLPFRWEELGTAELRLLTAFVGYPRSFYAAIPFGEDSLKPDPSFRPHSRRLRYAGNAVALYDQSGLPKAKTVRRLFFENPGLFFYLEESRRLWQIIRDPNRFLSVFTCPHIYQILADLHTRPAVFVYLEDVAATGRVKRLVKDMLNYWSSLCCYGVHYNSMSPAMKKRERDQWKSRKPSSAMGEFPVFAIPLVAPEPRIPNCTIDDFEFYWLKTTADYTKAGVALDNCLSEWSLWNCPVMGVRKNGRIVAAIEVSKNTVVQAKSAQNKSLDRVPGLRAACEKWYAKNRLKDDPPPVSPELRFLLEDQDLPF